MSIFFSQGDVVIFDNWRILHGRLSYVSKPGMFRHLEGAYLDWDEVMSRLRILHTSVHKDVWAQQTGKTEAEQMWLQVVFQGETPNNEFRQNSQKSTKSTVCNINN